QLERHRGGVEPIEMRVEVGSLAAPRAQDLEQPVAVEQAAVEHRDRRRIGIDDNAVDRDRGHGGGRQRNRKRKRSGIPDRYAYAYAYAYVRLRRLEGPR